MQRPLAGGRRLLHHAASRLLLPLALALLLLLPGIESALAHAVAEGDKGYIKEITGVHLLPFVYLGAKHMVTGYDHILFLFGVIFFLYRAKHIAIYVSLFALGHSTTMLLGVYFNVGINSYLIDAIIGLSVAYKALDNMGAFQRWLGYQPNTKAATLIFGLFHGFGLSTKILEYEISPDGLIPNLLAFNVGVELGQLAPHGRLLAPRLHRQCLDAHRGLRPRRLPTHRLLRFLKSQRPHLKDLTSCTTPTFRPAPSCRPRPSSCAPPPSPPSPRSRSS